MFDDPLHYTEVVHHLHKRDEKDDCTQDVGEEPAFVDGLFVEEEGCTDSRFLQEVGGEESKPSEEFEASIGLENEEGDGLLEKETDYDRLPANKFNSKSHAISLMHGGRKGQTYHGTWDRLWEVAQKQN